MICYLIISRKKEREREKELPKFSCHLEKTCKSNGTESSPKHFNKVGLINVDFIRRTQMKRSRELQETSDSYDLHLSSTNIECVCIYRSYPIYLCKGQAQYTLTINTDLEE